MMENNDKMKRDKKVDICKSCRRSRKGYKSSTNNCIFFLIMNVLFLMMINNGPTVVVGAFSSLSSLDDVIFRQGRKEDEWLITKTMMKSLMNPLNIDARRFVVAEEKKKVIGWAQLRPLQLDNGCWELASVYVNPMYRKRGIGSQLVRQIIQTKDEEQPIQIYALTLASTLSWYQRLGFDCIDTPPPSSLQLEIKAGQIITNLLKETLICIRYNNPDESI